MTARFLPPAVLVAAFALAAPAAPVPAAKVEESQAAKARKALDATADFALDQAPLQTLVEFVRDRFGVELVIDAPALAANGADPPSMTVTVTKKGLKLRDALRTAFGPLGLRFGVTGEGIVVSTEDGVIQRQVRQRVDLEADGRPLPKVLEKLAADTGANVVLDPRTAKSAAGATVTLRLEDVPLETAVRLAAEVAGLRAVRLSNVLFVTTEERARVLREDADGLTPANSPLALPGGLGGAVPGAPPPVGK